MSSAACCSSFPNLSSAWRVFAVRLTTLLNLLTTELPNWFRWNYCFRFHSAIRYQSGFIGHSMYYAFNLDTVTFIRMFEALQDVFAVARSQILSRFPFPRCCVVIPCGLCALNEHQIKPNRLIANFKSKPSSCLLLASFGRCWDSFRWFNCSFWAPTALAGRKTGSVKLFQEMRAVSCEKWRLQLTCFECAALTRSQWGN